MANTIIMLHKERASYQWSYIIDRQRYVTSTPACALLEQVIHVLTEIREKFDLYDENVTVCSTTLLRTVLYDLTITFPNMHFVPVTDSDVARVFRRVMTRASSVVETRKIRRSKTLFICSDASKSSTTDMCGWAWFSTIEGKEGYNFGVSEHHSTVSAELEGILHAIVENGNTEHTTIHVYCDSQRSVEWAQSLVLGKLKTSQTVSLRGRLMSLVHEAREIAAHKNIRIQWVRGHGNHRLNVAADFLSREARLAANRRQRLRKDSPNVEAVLTFISE
jgi:ribonuclease HI